MGLMVKNLGEKYEVLNNSFKPHASCSLTHPIIDAAIELRNRYGLEKGRIKEIQCEVSRSCLDVAGQEDPKTGLAGKFSLYYCAALALTEGVADESMFKDAKVLDPGIVEMQKRVRAKILPELKGSEAKVTIINLRWK